MPQPSNRLDAGERVFFDTQLVSIDKRTYLQKYPEFKSRRLIPMIPDIPSWARGHRWTATTEVGKARLAASNATDVPVVDVNSTKNESLIHKYWLSYKYDDDEIRAAIATGIPLDAARQALEVGLVQHQQLRNAVGGDFRQHLVDVFNLPITLIIGAVHHVQQQIGMHGFFQRGAKRRHQRVRQIADKAHGVGQHHRAIGVQV